MYLRIVSWLTVPAVALKAERVHMDGRFIRCGNSRRRYKDVTPLPSVMTSEALSLGVTRTNKWIWSG
jgi:hypothetical protein